MRRRLAPRAGTLVLAVLVLGGCAEAPPIARLDSARPHPTSSDSSPSVPQPSVSQPSVPQPSVSQSSVSSPVASPTGSAPGSPAATAALTASGAVATIGEPTAVGGSQAQRVLVGQQGSVGVTFGAAAGLIGCSVDRDQARCDIGERYWRPHGGSSCPATYGRTVVVGTTGSGRFTCAGGSLVGQGSLLAGGAVRQVGDFRCTVRSAEVECRNTRSGSGFTVSQADYRLY